MEMVYLDRPTGTAEEGSTDEERGEKEKKALGELRDKERKRGGIELIMQIVVVVDAQIFVK